MRYKNVIRFIALILILSLLLLAVVGCGSNNSTHNNENNFIDIGMQSLKEINDCLYYDTNTNIVYWWNGNLGNTRWDTTPSPYYAANGLPYKYNPQTNTFEEIKR